MANSSYTSISGYVSLDGTEPKPGILVQSVSDHTGLIVPADVHGAFTISGLAPGEYRIFSWDDINTVPYRSSYFMRRSIDKAVLFEINNGDNLTGLKLDCNKVRL